MFGVSPSGVIEKKQGENFSIKEGYRNSDGTDQDMSVGWECWVRLVDMGSGLSGASVFVRQVTALTDLNTRFRVVISPADTQNIPAGSYHLITQLSNGSNIDKETHRILVIQQGGINPSHQGVIDNDFSDSLFLTSASGDLITVSEGYLTLGG